MDESYDGDFQARRRGYLDGDDPDGWEHRAAVVERLSLLWDTLQLPDVVRIEP